MEQKKPENIAADLASVIRGDVYDDIIHRAAFAADASIYQMLPACVVAPKNASDVAAVVRYAHDKNIPIAARGAGTGLAGESLTTGILFDMTRYMNRIIGIKDHGQFAVCQPGVVLDELNTRLTAFGRKIGPDPSTANRATIGGCVANNATGAHSLQYGYIGDYIESIEAVLANGELFEFKNNFSPDGRSEGILNRIASNCMSLITENKAVIEKALPRTKRNRSGYGIADVCHNDTIDLARMLCGSEGTLCIFTEITLRTVAIPKAKGLIQIEFDSLISMAKAVPAIVDSGPSACEMIDQSVIDMAREAYPQYHDVLPEKCPAMLTVEYNADDQGELERKIAAAELAVDKIAKKHRAVTNPDQQRNIEKARKDAVPLLNRSRAGKKPIPFIEDVSVDNKQLVKYILALQNIASDYGFEMSFYGHAGDGELHVRPYLDLSDPADIQKMPAIANDVFDVVWSLGGSISGEHADGLVRAAFIKKQYGPRFYQILREIKSIFDPDGILNPDKIICDDPGIMIKNLRAVHEVDPKSLIGSLETDPDEFKEEIQKCNGCGLCLTKSESLRFCPVYRAVGDELASSRAKANVLRFWSTGQMKDEDFESPEFRKFLDLCVNCKACSVECPSGVDVSGLVTAARAEYAKRKGLTISQTVLSNNRLLSKAGTAVAPIANFINSLAVSKWALEKTAGIDKRRSLPKFAGKSFLKAGAGYLRSCPPIIEPNDKVAYFVDTYANYNDHELGFAVLEVLVRNNIEVIIPKQRPAPLPAVCYGDVKRARTDLSYSVKYLAQAVRDGYKIICSEPSAAVCLRDELHNFVDNEDARLVSKNTFELVNYLLDLNNNNRLIKPDKCIPKEYIYHLPCHLCAVGNGRATIELLRKLCDAKVTDVQAGCCGIAGTFGMQKKNYELSTRIAGNLKSALTKSEIDSVLTECSTCKMQIEHISDKQVTHPLKIIARAYAEQD